MPPVCARPYGTGLASAVNIALTRKEVLMNIHLGLTPLVSLLAGILILFMPRLLNFIVAAYLIVIGLIGLSGAGNMRF